MRIPTTYTKGEEIFSSISHGIGILLGVVGTTILVTLSVLAGRPLSIVSSAIYGFTLIIMYTMSTLYHAIPFPRVKRVFQILDHCSIYLLIAGTYTPITLVALHDVPSGLPIFITVWAAAIGGIVLSSLKPPHHKKIELVLYVVMGWAVVWDFRAVAVALGRGGLTLLLGGGICYTVGIIFYKMKQIPFMHGVWHLFVVSGSVLHYLCVLFYAR